MATPTIVVLVVGALATVLALVAVGTVLGQRVTRAYREASAAIERGSEAAQRVTTVMEVTRRELDELGGAGDAGSVAGVDPARSASDGT